MERVSTTSFDALLATVKDTTDDSNTVSDDMHSTLRSKQPFFALAGKIHLDKDEIMRYRQIDLI